MAKTKTKTKAKTMSVFNQCPVEDIPNLFAVRETSTGGEIELTLAGGDVRNPFSESGEMAEFVRRSLRIVFPREHALILGQWLLYTLVLVHPGQGPVTIRPPINPNLHHVLIYTQRTIKIDLERILVIDFAEAESLGLWLMRVLSGEDKVTGNGN